MKSKLNVHTARKPTLSQAEARRLAMLVACAMMASPAPGQDLLEPLMVTADQTGPPATDSLAVLSGGGDLAQLLPFQPNAHVGGVPGTAFSLRGVGQEGTLVPGNRTNTGLTVLSGNFTRSTNSLWVLGASNWDMRELAVAPGPALFGKGPATPGGELLMEPCPPEFTNHGRLLGEIGGEGHYRGGGTFNSVLIPDQLAMRLNVLANGDDGGITNVHRDDDRFASTDRTMLRGQWRWRPGGDETSVVDALVETTRLRGNPLGLAGMRPDFELFDRRVDLNTNERVPAEHAGLSLSIDVQPTPGRRTEAWLSLQSAEGYQLADFDSTPDYNWFYRVGIEEDRLGGGARHHLGLGDTSLLLGIFGDTADYHLDLNGRGFSSDAAGLPFTSTVEESVDMAALFVRAETGLTPGTRGFAGVRLDSQKRDVSVQADYPDTGASSQQDDVTSVEWLPELGLEWHRENLRAGIKVARSYRPAGIGHALSLGETSRYGAERGWEIQADAETEWNSLQIAGRLFHARLNGQQVPVIVDGGFSSFDQWILNAGSSTRHGAELEARWQGESHFHAAVNAGWLVTSYDDLDDHGLGQEGTAFPNAPEWNAGAIIAWNPETGWFGESCLRWQEETYAQFGSPDTTHLEARLELSARLGFRWRGGECYLFGTNLLNRDFALVRRDFTGSGRGIQGAPNLPRIIGVGCSVHW